MIDPSQKLDAVIDVAFSGGKVAQIGPALKADAEIDVRDLTGFIVAPGLIDLHTHVYWGGTSQSWPNLGDFAAGERDIDYRVKLLRRIDHAASAEDKVVGHCRCPLHKDAGLPYLSDAGGWRQAVCRVGQHWRGPACSHCGRPLSRGPFAH